MCGIAGEVSIAPRPLSPELRGELCRLLRHRGPDDAGWFESPGGQARLLHTRLSIIDLSSGGHQPMRDEGRATCLSYNGEIYNYRELDAELKALGCVYRSHSDTETILHAYAQWGEACVEHFNGMFAFALWDERRRVLFCARDRFGEKPFYYHVRGDGSFVFASEIKAVLAHPDVPRAADHDTLREFLAANLTDTGESTFFEGIRSLPAAHTLTWADGRLSLRRYWSVASTHRAEDRSTADWSALLLELLTSSIALRLRSDVPVGTCLSGGLDSSSIVTLMHEVHEGPISCFSVLYDDPELSERSFVDALVGQLPVNAHVAVPDGTDLHETLRRIVWHNDQPSSSMGQYSQWHAMKLAAEHGVVVLLNGQGGDEVLAGYDRYIATGVRAFALSGHPGRARRLARTFAAVRGVAPSLYEKQALYPLVPTALLAMLDRLSPMFTPARLAGPSLQPVGNGPPARAFRSLRAHLVADLTELSVPSLVHGEDRCSMAFSREIRLPFLDHRLVEMLLDVPQELKLKDGETKYLLRQAMRGRLPEAVRARSDKKGYPTPVGRWLRTCARAEAQAVIDSPELAARGYLDARLVQRLFREHCEGTADHGLLLWQCLGLEYWARVFLDRTAA
jgi:asparagine synthase (glutamine-hydrolysing)